jgi:hypothetical protein
MTPAEVAWRMRSAARVPWDYLEYTMPRVLACPRRVEGTSPGDGYPVRNGRHYAGVDNIRIFDLEFPSDFQFNWHCDYSTNKLSPDKFARSLNTRDTEAVGDVKYIWEINRHQHLSALAFSAHPQRGRLVADALKSWLAANPYLVGVNWTSSLELALRLISWTLIYPALRHVLDSDRTFREAFEQSVFLHMRQIRRNLSLFSSANNHLIGELAGLYCGSLCFPWWSECGEWRRFAKGALEKEALLQFAPDGVNREQALSYQLFTLELLLFAVAVGRGAGATFSAQLHERLRAAVAFLLHLVTCSGELPLYGDSDDARGFIVSNRDSSLHVILELAGRLFQEPAFLEAVPEPTAAAGVLLPPGGAPEAARARNSHGAFVCEDGGIAVLDGHGWKLVMDFGPLGYPRTAAHGHADALSVLLAVDGHYLLVDAGTYAYHSHPEWRTYFRGTAAHNTVRVDSLDQSVIAGRFLWGAQATATLLQFEEGTATWLIEAQHDGYRRLTDPVTHRRRVECAKEKLAIRVEDTLECLGGHDVELHWHLHESAEVTQSAQSAIVAFRGRTIRFDMCAKGFALGPVRGSEEPILGWRSPSFNVKVPITTLRFAGRVAGTAKIVTSITAVQ